MARWILLVLLVGCASPRVVVAPPRVEVSRAPTIDALGTWIDRVDGSDLLVDGLLTVSFVIGPEHAGRRLRHAAVLERLHRWSAAAHAYARAMIDGRDRDAAIDGCLRAGERFLDLPSWAPLPEDMLVVARMALRVGKELPAGERKWRVLFLAGKLHRRQHDWEASIEPLTIVASVEHWLANEAAGELLHSLTRTGREAEAYEWLARLRARSMYGIDVIELLVERDLAFGRSERGDHAGCARLYEQLATRKGNSHPHEDEYNAARCWMWAGDRDRALALITRLLARPHVAPAMRERLEAMRAELRR